MTAPTALLVVALAAQATDPKDNPVYAALRSEGINLGGARVSFPAPLVDDDATEGAEREALRKVAGSDRAVAELTRDSVAAPFVLKTRDQAAGDRGTVRAADLFFVVRARLDDIDPSSLDAAGAEGQEVEAGNMRFRGARVAEKDLASRGIKPADGAAGVREWYVHLAGRLLDRIHAEATDRITATRSSRSWLIAARTDPRFDRDASFPNRWHAITRRGDHEEAGPDETYPGGASYVRIGALRTVPGALLVEAHFAFFEPRPWFDGAPVLRSKIGLIVQDRVRSLRRDLAKSRRGPGVRKTSETERG